MIGLVNIVYREWVIRYEYECVGMEAIFVLCMSVLHFYAIMPLASFCPRIFGLMLWTGYTLQCR